MRVISRQVLTGLLIALAVTATSGCFGDRIGDAAPADTTGRTSEGFLPPPDENLGRDTLHAPKGLPGEGGWHTHDWWQGKTEYTIMDEEFEGLNEECSLPAANCVAYVSIPTAEDLDGPPNAVWTGTGRVEIDLRIDGVLVSPYILETHVPEAGGHGTRLNQVDTEEAHIVIDGLLDNNTDVPHVWPSAWSFRVRNAPGEPSAPAGIWAGTLHWTVTIHRGDRPLPLDPPHPSRWGGSDNVQLAENTIHYDANTPALRVGAADVATSSGPFWWSLPQNRTVPLDTSHLSVVLTWENDIPNQPGPSFTFCDATRYCSGAVAPDSRTPGSAQFTIPLAPAQWDSPYALESAWLLGWRFDNGSPLNEHAEVGLIQGKVTFLVTAHRTAS